MDPVTDIRQALLWSDPSGTDGERPNRRGIGTEFGPDVTAYTLEKLGVRHIIRSHEPRKAVHGPVCEQNERIVTLNSTDVYDGIPSFSSSIPMTRPTPRRSSTPPRFSCRSADQRPPK
jgi:serine/threonine-protein phosphatase 5